MANTKWQIVSNDGDTVVLRRETEDIIEEAELKRRSDTYESAWRKSWPVGAEFDAKTFHDKVNLEAFHRSYSGEL